MVLAILENNKHWLKFEKIRSRDSHSFTSHTTFDISLRHTHTIYIYDLHIYIILHFHLLSYLQTTLLRFNISSTLSALFCHFITFLLHILDGGEDETRKDCGRLEVEDKDWSKDAEEIIIIIIIIFIFIIIVIIIIIIV
ncbi:F1N21.1 [Arabidopsis thaliana]|uniref:F1N21.1 n=1 Tax=Arabidopsis thaliana TaxID=3702 RepID=Q9FYH4_ARATH|nr:F1N21.1 [Arabidopsis thaliana]